MEKIDKQAVKRAIRIGVCTIYYVRVHNFIHEKSEDILRSLYKSAVFVLQAIWFLETGTYIKSRIELQKAINPPSAVLTTAQELKSGASIQFEEMSEILLHWTKNSYSEVQRVTRKLILEENTNNCNNALELCEAA